MLSKKAIGHSLLFAGPEGVGKSLFAYALATQLICGEKQNSHHLPKLKTGHHPDVHIYRPEGKLGLHSVQTLRELCEEVHFPPHEAEWKIFIIHEADRMLTYSANALLKTLEEPPPQTLMILLSSSPASLLPTIISRCRTLNFEELSQHEVREFLKERYQLEDDKLETIVHLAQGSLSRALSLIERGTDPNRHLLFKTLDQGGVTTYKALSSLVQSLTGEIEKAKKQVEEVAKEELQKQAPDGLSAHQQHALEKELEGRVAMIMIHEFNALLEILLSWYRDLHLLKLNGSEELLINKDYLFQLRNALQRGNIPSLEHIQAAIEETRLALQRSTTLNICLENLLLKLNLISIPFEKSD